MDTQPLNIHITLPSGVIVVGINSWLEVKVLIDKSICHTIFVPHGNTLKTESEMLRQSETKRHPLHD